MKEINQVILLIDDESPIRRLLRQQLSKEGYHCLEAGNANQAREVLRTNTVGLAILDIRMPGETGLELLPEIKAAYPDLVVVMATADDAITTAILCLKQGAYDYLIKPFNLEEVTLCVSRALENRRLRIENRDYQINLEKKVRAQTEKIRVSFLNSVNALALGLEAKDEYTNDHSRRVAELAAAICRQLNMTEEATEKVRVAGLVHDIGKIGIKDNILNKPGKLTDDERRLVQNHPVVAARILSPVVEDDQIIDAILHHHERFDGAGYPDRLSGARISIGARILAVADAYDAMTSARPYREAMSVARACEEITRNNNSQFDPVIANALVTYMNTDVLLRSSW